MRKILLFLLGFTMLLSMTSCLLTPDLPHDTTDNGESTTEPPELPMDPTELPTDPTELPTDSPGEILESTKYYKIEKLILTTVRYSIYDSKGNVVLCEETDRPLTISMLNESIVDININMGTGITVHKYYDVQGNRFSGEYEYVVAVSGNLVAYIDPSSMTDSMTQRRLVVRDIFDTAVFYKSFRMSFAGRHYPVVSASFTAGEEMLELSYQSDYYWGPSTIKLPIRSSYASPYLEQAHAMDAYSEVLKNDIPVYEVNGISVGEPCFLRDIKTPYDRTPLGEIEELKYAYLDVDGDMINDLVIDCGDILVLRYYDGDIYVYPFTFRNMYRLNTDGSYNWTHTGQNFEYGERKLAFDGVAKKSQEIWRIVNDGEPNAEYYLEGNRVTLEELLAYFEDNPKTKVELLPLETTWKDEISTDAAVEIVQQYLKDSYGDEMEYQLFLTGYWDLENSFYVFVVHPTSVDIPSGFSSEIWIDKLTGEVIIPTCKG